MCQLEQRSAISNVVLCVWCRFAAPPVRVGDDLAFAIYQDPETGGLIRHLQRQKEVAVSGKNATSMSCVCCIQIVALYSGEDFSRAKLLKQAIVDLQKVCVPQYTHVHSTSIVPLSLYRLVRSWPSLC